MGLISRVSSRTYRLYILTRSTSQIINQAMKTQKEFEAAVARQQDEIIKNFDDNELRVTCKKNGLNCGPIPTPAIRKSWAKRLATKLIEAEMSQVEESSSGEDYEEEWETKPEHTAIPEHDTVEETDESENPELEQNNSADNEREQIESNQQLEPSS